MALKFGPDKRKGNKGRTKIDPRRGGKAGDAGPKFQRVGAQPRTNIDPRIGGTKGDAGFAGKAGKSGLGVAPGNAIAKAKRAKNRTTIDPRIGGQKGDAGFAGKKKSIAPGSFKEAFAVAYAKKPNSTFTYKGKKYKAIKKKAMKGPPKNRVEDKSITAASSVKGKRDTTKSKTAVKVPSGFGLDTKKKRKTTNAAGQKLGQRKAGGQIKKYDVGGKIKKDVGGKIKKYAKKASLPSLTAIRTLYKGSKYLKDKFGKTLPGKGKVGKTPKSTPKLPKMGDKPKKGRAQRIPQIPLYKERAKRKPKKMMGGGMAMKYKHGGMTKKCPRDGIAMKGKTRA